MDSETVRTYTREEVLQPIELMEMTVADIQSTQCSLLYEWEWEAWLNGELKIDTHSNRGALFLALEEQLVYTR